MAMMKYKSALWDSPANTSLVSHWPKPLRTTRGQSWNHLHLLFCQKRIFQNCQAACTVARYPLPTSLDLYILMSAWHKINFSFLPQHMSLTDKVSPGRGYDIKERRDHAINAYVYVCDLIVDGKYVCCWYAITWLEYSLNPLLTVFVFRARPVIHLTQQDFTVEPHLVDPNKCGTTPWWEVRAECLTLKLTIWIVVKKGMTYSMFSSITATLCMSFTLSNGNKDFKKNISKQSSFILNYWFYFIFSMTNHVMCKLIIISISSWYILKCSVFAPSL